MTSTDSELVPLTEDEELWLLAKLRVLRQQTSAMAAAKAGKESLTAEVIPLLRRRGSMLYTSEAEPQPKVVNIIEAETLQVEAGPLLEALIEQYGGDVDQATLVWSGVLKPPAVDTKDGGLFHQACSPTGERSEHPPLISAETVAKVATYKKAAAYVGFSKPG